MTTRESRHLPQSMVIHEWMMIKDALIDVVNRIEVVINPVVVPTIGLTIDGGAMTTIDEAVTITRIVEEEVTVIDEEVVAITMTVEEAEVTIMMTVEEAEMATMMTVEEAEVATMMTVEEEKATMNEEATMMIDEEVIMIDAEATTMIDGDAAVVGDDIVGLARLRIYLKNKVL